MGLPQYFFAGGTVRHQTIVHFMYLCAYGQGTSNETPQKNTAVSPEPIFATTFLAQSTSAQDGTDYAGPNTLRYAKLRRDWNQPGPIFNFFRNRDNEKAFGVYTEHIWPLSAFEVNTNFTHMPGYLTLWYNRGNVFRTSAPVGFTQQWQMFRETTPVARLFNDLLLPNDFQLESTGGNLLLNSSVTGNVGIFLINPNFKLDVNGDIAVDPLNMGYRIQNDYVLWHRGITSSINVGVQAGPVNTGVQNVFLGNQAGLSNTSGFDNTFVGFEAGRDNVAGHLNTFIGRGAGTSNNDPDASLNTFVGHEAGNANNTGHRNTFIGAWAGRLGTMPEYFEEMCMWMEALIPETVIFLYLIVS